VREQLVGVRDVVVDDAGDVEDVEATGGDVCRERRCRRKRALLARWFWPRLPGGRRLVSWSACAEVVDAVFGAVKTTVVPSSL
jgi:hypothetical protein